MGLPKLDIDVKATVREFLTVLKSINQKLDILIELERQKESR